MCNLYSDKIYKKIDSLKKNNKKVNELLEHLGKQGELLLLGGAIRDIIYDRTPRDYDFVVDTFDKELIISSSMFDLKRNSFNGYKITIDDMIFDIWALKDTWALKDKQNHISKYDLERSCFFNMDSIIYDLRNKELLFENFENGINNKVLDIIYSPNLYPDVCIIRAFVLKRIFNLSFSNRLKKYIQNWYFENQNNYINNLYNAQIKHYKEIILNDNAIINEFHLLPTASY